MQKVPVDITYQPGSTQGLSEDPISHKSLLI